MIATKVRIYLTIALNKRCRKWDKFLNEILDRAEVDIDFYKKIRIDRFTMTFPGIGEVWISNKFYCYGYAWALSSDSDFKSSIHNGMPKRKTICRLYELERKISIRDDME